MRKLPKEVRISGIRYKVELVPIRAIKGGNWGQAEYGAAIIRIGQELNPQRQWQVLLHEVLHMIFLDVKVDSRPQVEERIIESIDEPLFAFLRENGFLKI